MAVRSLSKAAQERLERQRIDQKYTTIRSIARVVGWMFGAWMAAQAVGELAGNDTSVMVSMLLSVVADLNFAISIALTGAAVAWAVVERVLRHRKVESMQGRVKELEKHIDPGRSSSGLTTKGQTNPQDR